MIKFGPNSISSIYFGDERIAEVYVGRKKVWPYYPGEGVYFGKGDVPNVYWTSELSSTPMLHTEIVSADNTNYSFFTFLDGRQFSYVPESSMWTTAEPFSFSGVFRDVSNNPVNAIITGAQLSYYEDKWVLSPLSSTYFGGN